MPEFQFKFTEEGADKIKGQFDEITKSSVKTQKSFKALSKDLGVSEGALQRIAKGLGLNLGQLRKVITSMAQWQAAGESNARQFAALNNSIDGIEPAQFRELAAIAQKVSAESKKATAETQKLAKATENVGKATQGGAPTNLAPPQERGNAQGNQTQLATAANRVEVDRQKAAGEFAIALNKTRDEALELARRLGLTGTQMTGATTAIAKLAEAGPIAANELLAVKDKFRISGVASQRLAEILQAEAQERRSRREEADLQQSSARLANAIGSSIDEAQDFAKALGLTAGGLNAVLPSLQKMVRSGPIADQALQNLGQVTGVSVASLRRLSTAIGEQAEAQKSAAQEQRRSQQSQQQLANTTRSLSQLLGVTDTEARRLASEFSIAAKEVAELKTIQGLVKQGQLTEQGIAEFAAASNLASDKFTELATAIQRRTQAEIEAANTARNERTQQREQRSQRSERAATSRVAAQFDINFDGAAQLSKDLGLTATATEKAVTLLKQLEKSGATANAQIEALGKTFNLNAQQARQLVSAYEGGKGSVENFGQNIASAAQDLGVTFGEARKLQKQLGLTSEQFEKAAQVMNQMRGAAATSDETFEALRKEVGLTNKQFQQMEKFGKSAQAGLQELAIGAGAVAVGVSAPLKQGIDTFVAFEEQMKQTGVLTKSVGSEDFAALEEEVKLLGSTTPKSASEIAEFTTVMARAGFGADQIQGSLNGIVNASIATGDSMQDVGDVIGATINQFGLVASDADHIADVLVSAANSSPQGINDLGEALQYVGSQANASGQTLESTVNVLARLAAAGIKGSAAGTAYAEAIRRVDLASAATTTRMGELFQGNTKATKAFEQLQIAATNTDGSLKQMPEVLDAIKTSTADLSKGDTAVLINSLFGVRGGRAILATLGLSEEKINDINKAQAEMGGIAVRSGEQMRQGLSGALKELDSALEGAFNNVGAALAPIVEPIVDGLSLLLQGFNDLPAPLQTALVGVAGFTAVLAAGIGIVAGMTAANAALGKSAAFVAAQEAFSLKAFTQSAIAKKASAAATAAYTVATKLLTGETKITGAALGSLVKRVLAMVPGMGAATLSTGGLSAAFGTAAGAAKGAIASMLPLLVPLAALAGAAAVLKVNFDILDAAFGQTEAEKKTEDALAKLRDTVREVDEATGKSAESVEGAGDSYGEASEQIREYGESFGRVSNEQLKAQRSQLDWQKTLEETSPIYHEGIDLLTQYGVVSGKTADDLSPEQLAKLQDESAGTIEKLKDAIAVLETVDTDEARQELANYQAVLRRMEGGANESTENVINSLDDMAKRSGQSVEELQDQLDELISGGLTEQDALTQLSATLEVNADTDPAQAELEKLQQEFDDRFAKQKIDIETEVQQGKSDRQFDFERKRDQEKAAFDDAQRQKQQQFEDNIAAQKREFEDEIAADKQAFEDKLQADKQAFEDGIENQKRAFEAEQEQKKLAFETQQEARKRNFETAQQDSQRRFEAEIEARKRAFAQQQQAAEKAFQASLEAEDQRQQGIFDEEQKGIDRQLELESADTDEERQQIEARFQKEDELAARREELEAGLQARREAWEEERRQREEAFNAQQEAERIAEEEAIEEEQRLRQEQLNEEKRVFEQQLRDDAIAFEDELEVRKQTFEENLATQKQDFEGKLEDRKRKFEDEIEGRKLKAEQTITNQKREFEKQLRNEQREFEDQQELKQKAFEDRERQLEANHKKQMLDLEARAQAARDQLSKDNAGKVKEILEGTDIAGLDEALAAGNQGSSQGGERSRIPGRFRGGLVKSGQPYWVGEFGPEIVTFPHNGRVLNRRDSIKAVQQSINMQLPAISANITAPVATVPHRGFSGLSGGDMRKMQKTLDSIDRKLSHGRGPTKVSAPSFTFNRWDNPDAEVFRAMKAMSRAGY